MKHLGFDIPNGVKKVWVSLHNRPEKDRAPVVVTEDGGVGGFPYLMYSPQDDYLEYITEDVIITNGQLDDFLEPLMGRKYYLQVEYQ